MPETISTIAVIFDFDDTLVPDSTTALLNKHGIDSEEFWKKKAKALVGDGFDPALAYLRLLLENIGPSRPLGNLCLKDLKDFGKSHARHLYRGLPGLIRDLRQEVGRYNNINIEFYIISGGLQEIVESVPLIAKDFSGVYACQLSGDEPEGPLKHIKRCVTFTEKTRYLFEINKGLDPTTTRKNPYLVNEYVPMPERRVPLKNMIYIGDGLTDIPCFSLLKNNGGSAFGVFDPSDESSAKRAFLKFLTPQRVTSIHAPKYRRTDELGSLIRASVGVKCAQIEVQRGQVES